MPSSGHRFAYLREIVNVCNFVIYVFSYFKLIDDALCVE